MITNNNLLVRILDGLVIFFVTLLGLVGGRCLIFHGW